MVRYTVDNGAADAMMSNSLKVTLTRSVLSTSEASSNKQMSATALMGGQAANAKALAAAAGSGKDTPRDATRTEKPKRSHREATAATAGRSRQGTAGLRAAGTAWVAPATAAPARPESPACSWLRSAVGAQAPNEGVAYVRVCH